MLPSVNNNLFLTLAAKKLEGSFVIVAPLLKLLGRPKSVYRTDCVGRAAPETDGGCVAFFLLRFIGGRRD
jgi:hypothetical protein